MVRRDNELMAVKPGQPLAQVGTLNITLNLRGKTFKTFLKRAADPDVRGSIISCCCSWNKFHCCVYNRTTFESLFVLLKHLRIISLKQLVKKCNKTYNLVSKVPQSI